MGAAVHVRLVEHEVKICAYSVGEGKCAEAANVGLGEVDDVIFVFVCVGANVGVENAVGAAGHDPCRVVVTAEAFEGDARAFKSDEFAKEIH